MIKKTIQFSGLSALLIICTFLYAFNNNPSNESITESKQDTISPIKPSDSLLVNDGPYIFINGDSIVEKNIVNSRVVTQLLAPGSKEINFKPEAAIFRNVKKIAAFSDLHGQYDLTIKILKNNKIIDDQLKWSFGTGHLVIVGDVFDRGDKVTELLWFIYDLEKQAKQQGGMLHYLLGNHEYMVLQNDLRYANNKYITTSALLNKTYPELFDKNTLLGRWLRSKPTMVKINDNLFVHGGISAAFVAEGFDLNKINKLMRASIDSGNAETDTNEFISKHYGNNGPIWYRGYFTATMQEATIDSILQRLNVHHIIVGHTSQKRIETLFNKKIFAVDSSIKEGEYGEILFIDKKSFCRATMNGELFPFE